MTAARSWNPGDAEPPARPVSVLVVDDNPVVRSGLLALLGVDPRLSVVGEAGNGEQAVEAVRHLRPDVTLMDIRMPRRDGLSAARELSSLTKVVMTTFTDTPEAIHDAVDAGAVGYLVHGTFAEADLVACVVAAAAGSGVFGSPALAALRAGRPEEQPERPSHGLSPRQIEIMDLIAQGDSNTTIARRLFLAEKTVKNHVNHIFASLGVTTRAQAVALWLGGRPHSVRAPT
ncbi:MAG: response regulator [Kineosporiaceae bacterium]